MLSQKGFSITAGDVRGHGLSTKEKTKKIKNWRIFADDLAAMAQAVADPPVIGIGHSIGGYFIYAAAAQNPGLFSALVLIDPIIFPSHVLWIAALIRKNGLAGFLPPPRMTRTKKHKFPSRQDALKHYLGKGMFAPWKEEFVRAYVDTAFEQDTAESIRLCCRPDFEAQIYETIPFETWTHAGEIDVPTLVIRGEHSDLFYRSAGIKLKKRCRTANSSNSKTWAIF